MPDYQDDRYIGNGEAFDVQQRYLQNNAERAMIRMARGPRHRRTMRQRGRDVIAWFFCVLIIASAFGLLNALIGH